MITIVLVVTIVLTVIPLKMTLDFTKNRYKHLFLPYATNPPVYMARIWSSNNVPRIPVWLRNTIVV